MPAGSRYVRSIAPSFSASSSDRWGEGPVEAARRAERPRAALDGQREPQRGGLVERPRDELDAAREPGRADAGRHGDGRQAGQVERRGGADERVLDGLGDAAEFVLVLAAPLGGRRYGRRDQRVEPFCLEGGRDRLLHESPSALSAEVHRGRKEQAGLEERSHLVLDRVGVAQEALLVVRRGFRGDYRELRREAALERGDRHL